MQWSASLCLCAVYSLLFCDTALHTTLLLLDLLSSCQDTHQTCGLTLLRASELQCELEGHAAQLQKGHSEQDKLQHSVAELQLEVSTSQAAAESAKKEAWALKGELKAHAEAAVKASPHLDL